MRASNLKVEWVRFSLNLEQWSSLTIAEYHFDHPSSSTVEQYIEIHFPADNYRVMQY